MSDKENKQKLKCSSVGGQAVLEGVMMQGKTSYCTAVRDPDGEIQVERRRLNRSPAAVRASKIPFVRGTVNLFSSLVRGTQTLMRSAQVFGEDDEEPSKLQKWFAEKFKCDLTTFLSAVSAVLGVLIAVALFIFLPQYLVGLLTDYFPALNGTVWKYVLLGVVKLAIFLAYLGLILLSKSIRRLYQYHGAEHKTINCYEKGLELTPENVASCSRIHDRCGTSFLFIVLIINVVIISLVLWALKIDVVINNKFLNILARIGVEIVLLPVIAGISYEILKILAKFHGVISAVLKSPGMLLQKVFTTREPTEDMIRVAIAAFSAAVAMDEYPEMEEAFFVTGGRLTQMLQESKERFAKAGIDESDAEWIYSLVTHVKRSDLDKENMVKAVEAKKIKEIEQKRLTGRPLWYIIGHTEFYGCKIKVDERVLIPRPETEILAESAVRSVEEGFKVLDLCTGSGCIAVSIAKHCKDKKVSVTAADVSEAALMLARENANYNSVDINFVESDLFTKVHGRFDLIICNPPYIKSGDIAGLQKEVREYEPRIALDGGEDGLEFYRRIAEEVTRFIARDGMLLLECGEEQAQEVLKLFEKREYAMIMKDYAGVDRFLKIAF